MVLLSLYPSRFEERYFQLHPVRLPAVAASAVSIMPLSVGIVQAVGEESWKFGYAGGGHKQVCPVSAFDAGKGGAVPAGKRIAVHLNDIVVIVVGYS